LHLQTRLRQEQQTVSVSGHAAIRMASAIGAAGNDRPGYPGASGAGEAEPAGRRLLRLIFGILADAVAELPEPLANLAAAPGNPAAFARFEDQVRLVLEASPEVMATATYVFGSPVSLSAFALVDTILLIGNHTISEYLRREHAWL
jgi:hypothetical protein